MTRAHRAGMVVVALLGMVRSGVTQERDQDLRGRTQEVDFSGGWTPILHEDFVERIPGSEVGDYTGLPINDAARSRADSWSEDQISMPEFQCRPESPEYGMRSGLAALQISAERDPITQRITSFQTRTFFMSGQRTIYLDGRPRPSANAPHSWSGFSTGVWNGNMLTITTINLKAFFYRRNGVPSSDRRTLTEYWVKHGDILTMIITVDDPVFFTERLVLSQSWARDDGLQLLGGGWCNPAVELPLGEGKVPHFLPGSNPSLQEVPVFYGIPFEVTRGGAEMMYPEYRKKMKQTYSTLDRCTRNCDR